MDETRPHDPHQPPLPPGGGGPDKTEDLSGISEIFGLDPEPAGDDPLVGTDLGGVTIVRLIAEGGMGRVYEGRQHRPDREVAVKVMRPGVSSAELLRRCSAGSPTQASPRSTPSEPTRSAARRCPTS